MTTPNAPDHAHGMDQQNSPHSSQHDGSRPGQPPEVPLTGETLDEAALGALMRDAVQGIKASPGALDQLRRAVPARRQHRRQALAGGAAALLLAGMAVPALLRAADTASSTTAAPANVASSHASAPDEDGHTDAWSGSSGPSGQPSSVPYATTKQQPPIASGTDEPSSAPPSPSGTVTPAVPDCSSAQLGQGASQAAAPDSNGRVYGWFRVANVSSAPCAVPSGGVVQVVTQGTADPSRIQVVDHSAGDAAAGLPPAASSGPVVLKPGENYEVAFAWVPAADGPGGCPAPSSPPASPTETPTPTDSASSPGSTPPGDGAGPDAPQPGGDTTASPTPGSVALNHTPAAGAPVIDGPVIQDACAGTVYTTTAIPAPTGTSGS